MTTTNNPAPVEQCSDWLGLRIPNLTEEEFATLSDLVGIDTDLDNYTFSLKRGTIRAVMAELKQFRLRATGEASRIRSEGVEDLRAFKELVGSDWGIEMGDEIIVSPRLTEEEAKTLVKAVSARRQSSLEEESLISWMERQVHESATGISFDHEPDGFRFLRFHHAGKPCKTILQAIEQEGFAALRPAATEERLAGAGERSACCNWPIDGKGCQRCGKPATPEAQQPAPSVDVVETLRIDWKGTEDEQHAARIKVCRERREQWGDDDCDKDGSCAECDADMAEELETRESMKRRIAAFERIRDTLSQA